MHEHFAPRRPTDEHYRTMLDIAFQHRNLAQVARCAALFSLAEHLGGPEPACAEAVAAAEGLHPGATFRLLRACVAFGLAERAEGDGFVATPLLLTLRKDDPRTVRSRSIASEGSLFWSSWGRLDQAVRTGEPQAEAALGRTLWEHMASIENAEESAAFTRSMAGLGADTSAGTAAELDTGRARFAVDVGGADGSLLCALMGRNGALRGAVLDLAHNEGAAREAAAASGVSERVGFVVGDFTKQVPAADLYLLRWILHDWPDDTCLDILRACRASAGPGARLAIVELLLDPDAPAPFEAGMDLNMLVSCGGRERTLGEFAALLGAAGFRLERHVAVSGTHFLIEASAA